ncbi:hypothetical protein [Litorivita sp. NS0012-18]|uniref:hypothetical protein n=1 Tax=Litorivita sp. NS0012-18 TaxID=3127655 RepID=UPI0031024366
MKPFFAFLLCAAASTAQAGSVGGASLGSMDAGSVVRDTGSSAGFSFDFDEVVKSGTTKAFPDAPASGAPVSGVSGGQGSLVSDDLFGDPAVGMNFGDPTELPRFGSDF